MPRTRTARTSTSKMSAMLLPHGRLRIGARGAQTSYGNAVNTARGHCQLEHPADLVLQFWAPSEQELLLEGAHALVGVLTDGLAVTRQQRRRMSVEAFDDEDRLVRWLNEVLLLATIDGFLLADAELRLHEGGLTAEIWGEAEALDRIGTEVKGVTYHDLVLRREEDRFVGQVVVDV